MTLCPVFAPNTVVYLVFEGSGDPSSVSVSFDPFIRFRMRRVDMWETEERVKGYVVFSENVPGLRIPPESETHFCRHSTPSVLVCSPRVSRHPLRQRSHLFLSFLRNGGPTEKTSALTDRDDWSPLTGGRRHCYALSNITYLETEVRPFISL